MPKTRFSDFDTAKPLKINYAKIYVKKSKIMAYWEAKRWNNEKSDTNNLIITNQKKS